VEKLWETGLNGGGGWKNGRVECTEWRRRMPACGYKGLRVIAVTDNHPLLSGPAVHRRDSFRPAYSSARILSQALNSRTQPTRNSPMGYSIRGLVRNEDAAHAPRCKLLPPPRDAQKVLGAPRSLSIESPVARQNSEE